MRYATSAQGPSSPKSRARSPAGCGSGPSPGDQREPGEQHGRENDDCAAPPERHRDDDDRQQVEVDHRARGAAGPACDDRDEDDHRRRTERDARAGRLHGETAPAEGHDEERVAGERRVQDPRRIRGLPQHERIERDDEQHQPVHAREALHDARVLVAMGHVLAQVRRRLRDAGLVRGFRHAVAGFSRSRRDSTASRAAAPMSVSTSWSAKSIAVPGPREVMTPWSTTTASVTTIAPPASSRKPG